MRAKLTMLLLLFTGISIIAQEEKDKVLETVNQNTIEGHIYFLADDLLKGRETGTQENKIAAAYLANTLRSYGVQPNPETGNYYQEVPMERSMPAQELEITLNNQAMAKVAPIVKGDINYEGEFIYVGYGLESDYDNIDVSGKIVLVKAGNEQGGEAQRSYSLLRTKRDLAKENGVRAIIELIGAQDQMWGYIDYQFNAPSIGLASEEEDAEEDFAYVWVQDADGSLISGISESTSHTGQMRMVLTPEETFVSYNVVGMVPGTDPKLKDEFIIYSAHYDHVGIGAPDATGDTIYNGARDNAVGTTTVLSMAENLTRYPTKRSALFILFTGEEKGLLGSEYYVEHPAIPLKQMVYCFNSDNGGYNDTSLATIIGLSRTTASSHIKKAASAFGLTATDDPVPEQGLFDRSDNVNFAQKGIPAPTFGMGFTAFDEEIRKYYHQAADEADSMDFGYLEKFFRAYVLAGRLIGNDPVTPAWTTGDKYEAAAKALYQE
ncbi:MAG: M28 family peptidase [Eudoraea sp.]|nr:M28 family peptidase [Eudoraea sp.]